MDFGKLASNPMGTLNDMLNGNRVGPEQNPKAPKGMPSIPGKTQSIDGGNWNQLFKYTFAVHDSGAAGTDSQKTIPLDSFGGLSEVDLGLPPQSLNVQTHFASTVSATNHGVFEENNGVVFRTIQISGTTGVLPKRQPGTHKPKGLIAWAGAVAPGFTEGVGNLIGNAAKTAQFGVKSFNTIATNLGLKKPAAVDVNDRGKYAIDTASWQDTGYYQFWQLHNFLVAYAEFKKTKKGESARLVFRSHKDRIGYVCTPVSFDLRRDANNPLLYRYSITLRAWEVFTLGQIDPTDFLVSEDIRNPAIIKSSIAAMQKVRTTLNSVANPLKGIQSDIQDVAQLLGQIQLLKKDWAGLSYTVGDFFKVIQSDAQRVFDYNKARIQEAIDQKDFETRGSEPSPILDRTAAASAAASGTPPDNTPAADPTAVDPITGSPSAPTSSSSPSGETSSGQASGSGASDGGVTMKAFMGSGELTNEASIDDLSLTPAVLAAIDNEVQKASQVTTGNVREALSKLQEMSDNLMALSGSIDETYSRIYNVPMTNGGKTLTDDDIILAAQLQEAKAALTAVMASGLVFQQRSPNPFNDANAAVAPGEELSTPNSAIPVYVDRGATLESIAYRYFQDVSKARDIAVLNNLRAPYIDEDGFTLPIFAAAARSFVIRTKDNMALNQRVTISGTGIAATARRVIDISDIGGGSYRVTVDGNDDLDKYTPSSNPFLTARLPGTIGSGDIVLLPSPDQPDDPIVTPPTPLLSRLSHAEKVFKIDVALDNNGDLAIDPSGDLKRSFGYQNAVQALQSIINVEEGELERHPTYGLPSILGEPNNGLTPAQIVEIIRQRIVRDPRFADADISVSVQDNVVRVLIEAKGAGGTGRIPLEFEVTV